MATTDVRITRYWCESLGAMVYMVRRGHVTLASYTTRENALGLVRMLTNEEN